MRNFLRSSFFGDRRGLWPVLLLSAVILLFGCQAQEATVNPGAATFKQELKACLTGLSVTLIEPVTRKDMAGIMAALANVESPAVKLCRMCPFEIGVLNPVGETMASYPVKGDGKMKDYSNYELVKKAISSKRIQQQGLFLPDGSKLFLVCAPLVQKDVLIGLVAIAISSAEAEKRWGLTEKEFLALDFNT
jgi:hypothetical protein